MVNVTRQGPPPNWTPPEFDEKEVHVLTSEEFTRFWAEYQRSRRGQSEEAIAERYRELTSAAWGSVPTFASPARDAANLARLARDLRRGGSMFTTYKVIRRGGRTMIAFRGNHRLRQILRGTLYNADSAQVVRMAIGPNGLWNSAVQGVKLTIIVSAAIRTLEWLFDSDTLWNHLLANLTSDLLKGVIAAGVFYAAGAATAGVFVFFGLAIPTVAPTAAGILVAFGAAIGLDQLDQAYEISEEHLASFWKTIVEGTSNVAHRGTTWIKNTAVDVYEYVDSAEISADVGTVSGPRCGGISNPYRCR